MINKPTPLEIKSLSPFIDPFFMNATPGIFLVGGDNISIEFPSGGITNYQLVHPLEKGTKLRMEVSRSGVRATLQSEEDQFKQDLQQQRADKLKAERAKAEELAKKIQNDAELFNSSLNLPFRWCSDIKVVMSGLMENSNGSGVNKRSVQHVRVLEAYSDGRLKRDFGDFLCGRDESKHQGYTDHAWDAEAKAKITCKQCIKVAKRFAKK